MKKLVFLLISILSINGLNAQQSPKYVAANTVESSTNVKGKIVDTSNNPVEYASVTVLQSQDDQIITGGITDSEGNFEIKDIEFGSYYLKVDFIGYKTFTTGVFRINNEHKVHDFGSIKISSDADVLDEVTVTAERTYIENKIDKKVVNIGKDLMTAGASASEIMQNIPSVDVDIDGNISLRGSENVRILVDGRPTNMESDDLLASIPAENIEKVEIITNPSAKYDPEGISGILNIVLKKDKKLGFNGSASAGIGSQKGFSGVNKYNGSLNLNYNVGDWNFFVNYGYRDDIRESEGEFVRNILASDGSVSNSINQLSGNFGGRLNHRVKAGIDYNISENTMIGYTTNMNLSQRSRNNTNSYSLPFQIRESESLNDGKGFNHEIVLKHNFSEESKLEMSVFRDDDADLTNGSFDAEDVNGKLPSERDMNDSFDNMTSAQADYTYENDLYKIEAGVKWQNRFMDSDYQYYAYDAVTAGEILDANRSNRFQFDENLYSAYTNYGRNWDKWSAQVGIRYELAKTSSTLVGDPKSPYDNNYSNLFPSVFVVRKITDRDEIGLSYSKRVSRPRSRQLNPAKRYSDTLNIFTGNPYLNPEFTNSYEVSYNRYWKGGSFNSAFFYRTSTDVIQRVNRIDANGVATRTFDNIAKSNDLGFEASVMSKIFNWWSLNANFNIYKTELLSNDPDLNNDGMNWFTRINNTFNVGKSFSIQASGRYMGKRVIPQGSIDPMYGLDLGLKYTFMDKKANIGFRLSDVFNTMQFKYTTTGSGFNEIGTRKWESQVAYVTFTYNFGQASKKKKDERSRGDENQGDEMGEF